MCDSKIIGKEFIARGLQCVGIREIPVVDDWSDRKCKEDAWESKNVRKNKRSRIKYRFINRWNEVD